MYRLMYMSTATQDFSNEELEELLAISRKNNSLKNITGLLIIKGRTFIQCLEGEEKDVNFVFSKIKEDPRHRDIIELIEEDSNKRYFPKWDMGFKNIRHLTNIESSKLKDFSLEDLSSFQKEDISQLIKKFIEDY